MNNLGFCPGWYGKNANLLEQHPGYSIVSYKCSGKGILYDYSLFPGINLIFMDFNCRDTFEESSEIPRMLDLRHYREGRVEFEFSDKEYFIFKRMSFVSMLWLICQLTTHFPLNTVMG